VGGFDRQGPLQTQERKGGGELTKKSRNFKQAVQGNGHKPQITAGLEVRLGWTPGARKRWPLKCRGNRRGAGARLQRRRPPSTGRILLPKKRPPISNAVPTQLQKRTCETQGTSTIQISSFPTEAQSKQLAIPVLPRKILGVEKN